MNGMTEIWKSNMNRELKIRFFRGGSRNFRKGGGGGAEAKFKKGGAGIRLFSAAFSHFLINLLQILQQRGGGGGGGAARPAPPLNPRLIATIESILLYTDECESSAGP